VVQQEHQLQQQQQHLRDSISDFRRMNSAASSIAFGNTKEVESTATACLEVGATERQDQLLLTNREERKRKKIDSVGSLVNEATSGEKDKEEARRQLRGDNNEHRSVSQSSGSICYSKNNMTPSSLLLLQNHNYIEQQQQRNTDNYDNDTTNLKNLTQEREANNTISCSGAGRCAGKQSDDHSSLSQSSTKTSVSAGAATADNLSLPASLMLTNINQFKPLDGNGNSSINSVSNGGANRTTTANSNNNILTPTSSANNVIASSDYHQDLSHIHNQRLTEADVLAANSINSLQQNYQQSLANCDFKQASGSFVQQYSAAQNNRLSGGTVGYHHSFPSPHEQPIKLPGSQSLNSRNTFEEDNSIITDHGNNIRTGNHPNVESLNVAQDLAQHQAARTASLHQYYNNHYNLMPTSSSQSSSSPTSSTSTPSPKTSAMHSTNNTSQHSNHIVSSPSSSAVATNSPPTPHIHLNHFNQHYVNNSATASVIGINHQQHQVSQHYAAYNQQTAGAPNQHHLAMSNHDQAFAHHHHNHHQQQQQHHQNHHQQAQHHHQQQQEQHHHQQQQQSQQQQQQQHNIHSQQSIYHQLATNSNVNMNHMYVNAGTHYQGHLQNTSAVHQHSSNLMSGSHHQNQLNSAAAACAAAAVVSQTLKTVANQHNQQHHYGGSISGSFNATSTGGLINITAQHHQQFHTVNPLNQHHLGNQNATSQQQTQNLPVHHTTSIVTRKYQCKMCPQVSLECRER